MDNGIWKIATAKLCGQCIRDMEDEYIFSPMWRRTLGSLFDGIGGFPLCFERIHGKGTARWASEIEPFPIAVTKRWFGEE